MDVHLLRVDVNWFTGVVLYVLIWWTVLFAVLPIGTRPVRSADEQTGWRGAPEQPRLLMKVIVTTLVAGVVWFGAWLLITSDCAELSATAGSPLPAESTDSCASSRSGEEALHPPTCRVTAFPPQTWPAPVRRPGRRLVNLFVARRVTLFCAKFCAIDRDFISRRAIVRAHNNFRVRLQRRCSALAVAPLRPA